VQNFSKNYSHLKIISARRGTKKVPYRRPTNTRRQS